MWTFGAWAAGVVASNARRKEQKRQEAQRKVEAEVRAHRSMLSQHAVPLAHRQADAPIYSDLLHPLNPLSPLSPFNPVGIYSTPAPAPADEPRQSCSTPSHHSSHSHDSGSSYSSSSCDSSSNSSSYDSGSSSSSSDW